MPHRLKPIGLLLYNKIAEPRVFRIIQFAIYALLLAVSVDILNDPPNTLRSTVGNTLTYAVGGHLGVGCLLGLFAVLPGIWWLERVGIILMSTGMAMYFVMVFWGDVSVVGAMVAMAFLLTFVQRWMEIRDFQLAPLVKE